MNLTKTIKDAVQYLKWWRQDRLYHCVCSECHSDMDSEYPGELVTGCIGCADEFVRQHHHGEGHHAGYALIEPHPTELEVNPWS